MASNEMPSSRFHWAALLLTAVVGCGTTARDSATTADDEVVSGSTLFVSDIDDTIKRTAVRGGVGVVGGAAGSMNEFAGMSILYRHWRGLEAPSKDLRYLTAAPDGIAELGSSFLTVAGFPGNGTGSAADAVIAGRSLERSPGDFKSDKLARLYDSTRPELTILVGDNGEQDMPAYASLVEHARERRGGGRVASFIHHVYETEGTPITAPHQPWLTSADLAVRFFNESWIDEAALTAVLEEVAVDSGEASLSDWVVPSFMECRHFDAWPRIERPAAEATRALYEQTKTNVIALCRK